MRIDATGYLLSVVTLIVLCTILIGVDNDRKDLRIQLQELESKKVVYEAMTEMNLGVWCELSVHYDWTEKEDQTKAQEIIISGVHDD